MDMLEFSTFKNVVADTLKNYLPDEFQDYEVIIQKVN